MKNLVTLSSILVVALSSCKPGSAQEQSSASTYQNSGSSVSQTRWVYIESFNNKLNIKFFHSHLEKEDFNFNGSYICHLTWSHKVKWQKNNAGGQSLIVSGFSRKNFNENAVKEKFKSKYPMALECPFGAQVSMSQPTSQEFKDTLKLATLPPELVNGKLKSNGKVPMTPEERYAPIKILTDRFYEAWKPLTSRHVKVNVEETIKNLQTTKGEINKKIEALKKQHEDSIERLERDYQIKKNNRHSLPETLPEKNGKIVTKKDIIADQDRHYNNAVKVFNSNYEEKLKALEDSIKNISGSSKVKSVCYVKTSRHTVARYGHKLYYVSTVSGLGGSVCQPGTVFEEQVIDAEEKAKLEKQAPTEMTEDSEVDDNSKGFRTCDVRLPYSSKNNGFTKVRFKDFAPVSNTTKLSNKAIAIFTGDKVKDRSVNVDKVNIDGYYTFCTMDSDIKVCIDEHYKSNGNKYFAVQYKGGSMKWRTANIGETNFTCMNK